VPLVYRSIFQPHICSSHIQPTFISLFQQQHTASPTIQQQHIDNITNVESSLEEEQRMSTSHFPLEISTDNGGVNALLPSGRLLIDKTSSSSPTAGAVDGKISSTDNSDSDQIQHKGRRKVKRDESGISDQIPSLFIDEKRCSETPNTSPMSNNTARDEGPLSPAEPLINTEVEENSLLEGNSLIGNNSTVVTNQQQTRHPQEQGLIEIGSRSRSESPSILQTQTNSSSIISDDITFNSYAPSELSSMMSHMEIQNLLKQGRKQQHEMMAAGGNNGNNRSIPVDIRGRESPMKLFHNQSLYANVYREEEKQGSNGRGGESDNNPCPDGRRITRGVGGGRPPTPPIPQSISSPSRKSQLGSSVYSPTIQSNPSSSSHLLHRTDAMEDNGSISDAQVHHQQQQQRQGYYPQPPQIIQNNSTWTSLPSMSSTVTPGQNNNYELYSRGDGRLEVRPPSTGEDESSSRYQEIGHSTPLRSPLSAQNNNNDQVGLKVDVVEIAVSDDNEDEAVESVLDDSASAISLGTTAQSVLGTNTKSLADDLNYYEDDNNGDRKQPQYATIDPRAQQMMHSSTSPPPIPHTSVLSGVDDGSYFADRSGYNNVLSSAHDISDYSTSVNNSFSGMDLKKAMPMNVASEDETENRHHQYGYGHTYKQQPQDVQRQPQMNMVHSKPIIPSTFPSLMDSSVSSGLTEITFPSMAPSLVSVKCSQSEREEREDSLPPHHVAQQHMSAQEEGANVTVAAAAAQHNIDPLMTTTTSQPSVMMHHHTQAAPPQAVPTAHSSDPRMNIEYERQYIVDLEQIVEESSNHDLRSGGASTASSPIASPRRNKGPGGGAEVSNEAAAEQRRFQSIPEGHNNQQQQQQQPQMLNYHPTEFFDYRHQYYTEQINTEQYHYFDDRYSQASTNHTRGEDETEASSTCSSVTLSQAFHHSDGTDSCASSMTDEYSESHSSHPSLTSTVSSVTLSHALSVDRHDHSGQGFYVATRLGNFVDVPTVPDGVYVSNDVNVGDEPFSSTTTPDDGDGVYKTEEVPQHDDLVEKTGEFTIDSTSGSFVRMNSESTNKSGGTDDSTDAVSDITAAAVAKDDINNKKSDTQVSSSTGNSLESELLATLVPECGVPIPSVMAKVGTARARSSSKGGMLLPWHSTRSIQNYQGRRGSKKLYSSRSREGNLYSISSVHTFRG